MELVADELTMGEGVEGGAKSRDNLRGEAI